MRALAASDVEGVLAFRARRALAHFRRLAEDGPVLECPICGHVGRFAPVRCKPSVWCPVCDSRPRHRLLKLWLMRGGGPPAGARVLHFAAEPWMRDALPQAGEYTTADINDRFDVRLDITAMDLPDGRFDAVIANHVLEHVDDRAALAEMFRVLSSGGMAVLTVPLVEGWDATLEAEPGWGAAERLRWLTDPTHERMYGRDFRDRLRAAGFEVAEFAAVEPDVSRHGLHRGERVFVARKPE